MFVENYFYLQTFDIADTSSMQDACHINFVIDLAHRGISVAHWLEHRSAESPKVRDSIPHRNSEFFLCPTLVTRRKHLSLFSLPSSKLTMSLISTWETFDQICVIPYISLYADLHFRESINIVRVSLQCMVSYWDDSRSHTLQVMFDLESEWTVGVGGREMWEEVISIASPPPLLPFDRRSPPESKLFISLPGLPLLRNQTWQLYFSLEKYWALARQNYSCSALL